MTDNKSKPDTIWGLPVVISGTLEDKHIYIACGDWAMRLKGRLEFDGEHYILRLDPPTTVIVHDPE
jgi:hypothetical protein